MVLVTMVAYAEGDRPATIDSAVSTAKVAPRCVMSIGQVNVSDLELNDTLDLLVETNGVELAGCGLKLAVASPLIGILEILPGELVDSCRWEMFRTARVTPQSGSEGISELWQITALAQGVSFPGMQDETGPLCYRFDRPASLARLVLSSAHVPSTPDTTVPIFFYWESCRDNVISDRKGESILISDTVIDLFPLDLTTDTDQFPTRHGSPSECVSARAVHPPRRAVEFRNGGVEFKFELKPKGREEDTL